MILIFLMYALIASTFTISKAVLDYTSPLFFISFRMIVAGLILLSYHFYKNKKINIEAKDIAPYLLLSLIYIYIPYLFELWAMKTITSARAALIYNLTPFFTAVFAYYSLREKLNIKKVAGLLVGFLAYVPLFSECLKCNYWYLISAQDLALLVATACGAYSWIAIKQFMNKGKSIIEINGVAMLTGGVMALISALMFKPSVIYVENWPSFIWLVALVILIGNIISYNLYGMLLKKYNTTFLSFCGFTTPLFAAAYQWAIWGETISWHFAVALIGVTIGLYLFKK
jgi:drug/metabolite transporter (DMT)-like permease